MTALADAELVLLPSLAAHRTPDGRLLLTRKYLDGAAAFRNNWPGPVTSLLNVTERPSSEMDLVEIDPVAGDAGLELRPSGRTELGARLSSAAAVLAHLSPDELDCAMLCRELDVPIHFTSEYTPETERQIVDAGTRNPALRLRRKLWLRGAEKIRRRILRDYAAGLQCSGTPTYELYRSLFPDAHLFFDNRVREAQVISEDDLAAKCMALEERRPLRLVFGGRLVAMKGVLDLPRVAAALIERELPFSLDIVGHGPLEDRLRREIEALGDDRVRLRPAMEFLSGWIPYLRQSADLFLCCHPQGDPSSTYTEVMSCGVPIIGYDNEAWSGVQRCSGAGWRVPTGNWSAMAAQVERLHGARREVAEMAQRGRDFSAEHCFEKTFAGRSAHLLWAVSRPDR